VLPCAATREEVRRRVGDRTRRPVLPRNVRD
jgi:hypothetical protein